MIETVAVVVVAGAAIGLLARFADRFLLKRAPGGPSDPPDARLQARLQGLVPGHALRVERYTSMEDEPGLRLVLGGLCRQVSMRRRQPGTLSIADRFEAAADVDGPADLVSALFDTPARRAVLNMLWGTVRLTELRLSGGELEVDVPTAGFGGEHPGLQTVARAAAELAKLLVAPADVPGRLARNARRDPDAAVRLGSLRALVRHHGGHPAAQAALRQALADEDGWVRLHAARTLAEAGRSALLALAADRRVEDGCSAEALVALRKLDPPHLPFPHAERVLAIALPDPPGGDRPIREHTALLCLETLGRSGEPQALPLLGKVLLKERGEVAVEAARALREAADVAAEGALVRALERPDEGVRVAAARALGELGTAAAVLPLKEAAERHDDLRGAARQAVAEIQARLKGSPGDLSLAGGESGQVTLADEDRAGRVSLPPPSSARPADGD